VWRLKWQKVKRGPTKKEEDVRRLDSAVIVVVGRMDAKIWTLVINVAYVILNSVPTKHDRDHDVEFNLTSLGPVPSISFVVNGQSGVFSCRTASEPLVTLCLLAFAA